MLDVFKMKKLGIFAGGVLFGTAGVKLLSSKDAKKVYTNCTAAVLRAKDSVMKTASTVQEMQKIFWRKQNRSMKREQQKKQLWSRKQKK